MALDPRIGTLNSGRFYCFPNGYDRPEVSGTLEDVEAALGLRTASKSSARLRPLREYRVAVMPRIMTYAGSQTFGDYTVVIAARSGAEAIKTARQDRRGSEGRYGVAATYRAKRIEG